MDDRFYIVKTGSSAIAFGPFDGKVEAKDVWAAAEADGTPATLVEWADGKPHDITSWAVVRTMSIWRTRFSDLNDAPFWLLNAMDRVAEA